MFSLGYLTERQLTAVQFKVAFIREIWLSVRETRSVSGRVGMNEPYTIIHNPSGIIKCANIHLSLSYPRSSDHSVFCRVNFHFFATNFCFKFEIQALRDTRHAESCPGLASQSVYMKKSCPACQGYPTCRGETTRPPELSRPPRRVRVHNVNG